MNILEAARYAERMHRWQIRKYTGEPYIMHPARVAGVISFLPHSTEEMVQAAWLHDVVEDCDTSIDDIAAKFPYKVASLVQELTNPSKQFPDFSRRKRKEMDRVHAANMSKEAKIIKMVDRIDNLNSFPVTDPDAVDFVRNLYYEESYKLYEVIKDADYEVGLDLYLCLVRVHKNFFGE